MGFSTNKVAWVKKSKGDESEWRGTNVLLEKPRRHVKLVHTVEPRNKGKKGKIRRPRIRGGVISWDGGGVKE